MARSVNRGRGLSFAVQPWGICLIDLVFPRRYFAGRAMKKELRGAQQNQGIHGPARSL
jgi:hypothetical protein